MTALDPRPGADVSGAQRSQYLSFSLAKEEYAIDILSVQEIKGFTKITPLPHSPPEVKGVMNLRGAVIPIIDVRVKFGLNHEEFNRFSVIIVVTLGTKIVGLVVDAVSDVLNISHADVDPPPEFGSGMDVSFMRGIARVGERLVTLFNVEHLVGSIA